MKYFFHYYLKYKSYYAYKYIKFIVIGILSNIVSYALFTLFLWLKFSIDLSASFGMIAGVLNTYLLSRLYLNEKAVNHSNLRMLVFFLYYAIAIFLTSNSIEWLTEKNNINHNISWLMCTIIASFFNFIFVSKIALHLKQYS